MEQNPSSVGQADAANVVPGAPQRAASPTPDGKPKKGLWLTIGGIVIVLIGVVVAVILAMGGNGGENDGGQGGNGNQGNNDGSGNSSSQITNIDISFSGIVALTGDNTLWGIGSVYGLGEGVDKVDEPTVLAKNVSSFIDANTLYYLDNAGTLYRAGLNYNGGKIDAFEKTYDDVVSYATYNGFCLGVVTKSGDAYVNNGRLASSYSTHYCGLKESTDGFEKIASSVKQYVAGYTFGGYINDNNELWMATWSEDEYSKKLDDVIDYMGDWFLTGSGDLYKNSSSNEMKLVETNVERIGSGFIKKKDGKFYLFREQGYYYPLDYSKVAEEDGYYILPIDDVQDIYYESGAKLIYVNRQGKIVLSQYEEDPIIVENVASSIKDIYEFVNNY